MNVLVNTGAFDADIILTALELYAEESTHNDVDVDNLIERYRNIVVQTNA